MCALATKQDPLFFLCKNLLAALSDVGHQDEYKKNRGTEKQNSADRARYKDREVAAGNDHRLAERFLHPLAEDHPEDQWGGLETELAHGVSEQTESGKEHDVHC